MAGWGSINPPFCRHHPLCLPSPAAPPAARTSRVLQPLSPSDSRRLGKHKPAEYDRKVAWEAYVAQFEMLISAQGQRACYGSVAEDLRDRFGHHLQDEVYQARLKKRTRERGKTLSQSAQDVEALVRRSYPTAPEEMIVVLARDSFIDALDDQQQQIYVKQAHPWDLQVSLARALESEDDQRPRSGRPTLP